MFGIRKKGKSKETRERKRHSVVQEAYRAGGYEIKIGNAQHQGRRDYQEDSFGISDTNSEFIQNKGVLAILADGMGGLSNGKAVSEHVISSLLAWFRDPSTVCRFGQDIKNAVTAVNAQICDIYCRDGNVNSGSTVIATLIKDGVMHWLAVGDSRIYLKRGARMYQVNEDHDFLNQLLDDVITSGDSPAAAFSNPQKDSLVGCIGKPDLDCFDYSKRGLPLCNGDKIVLCSDGVYNALSTDEINSFLSAEPMIAAENIKNAVLKKHYSGQDNLTVIVISINQ